MIEKGYFYLKNYHEENNPLMGSFILTYPVLISAFSLKAGVFIAFILSILIVTTKVFSIICRKFLPKLVAYNLLILYTGTYVTLVYLIAEAMYPEQIKILFLPVIFLGIHSIINEKLKLKKINQNILFCLLDGIIFFTISMFFIFVISLMYRTDVYKNQMAFTFLLLSIASFILNFARLEFENYFNKKQKEQE